MSAANYNGPALSTNVDVFASSAFSFSVAISDSFHGHAATVGCSDTLDVTAHSNHRDVLFSHDQDTGHHETINIVILQNFEMTSLRIDASMIVISSQHQGVVVSDDVEVVALIVVADLVHDVLEEVRHELLSHVY